MRQRLRPPPSVVTSSLTAFAFILLFTTAPIKCDQKGNEDDFDFDMVEHDDPLPEDYWKEIGIKMGEKEFKPHWPPKNDAGADFDETEDGLKEWEKQKDGELDKYTKYLEKREEVIKEQKIKFNIDDSINITFGDGDHDARPYPFCVDGYSPIMNRFELVPDENNKNDPVKPLILRPKAGLNCHPTDDNVKPSDDCFDPDLKRFIPIFGFSMPGREIVEANLDGKPDPEKIKHIDSGGNPTGPYITGIQFTKIRSPPAKDGGISFQAPEGSPELPFWVHLTFKSRTPLKGLYVQAIGFPMGLPFGQFRDDFDCKGPSNAHPVNKYNPDWDKPMSKDGTRANIIVPCKYSHGNNNGDMYPHVYAYGGNTKVKYEARSEFRMHFNWASVHCNLKTRVQFLVLAVRDFQASDFEMFLTATYGLNQNNAAGSPPPYIPGSMEDFGWDGRMECADTALIPNPASNTQVARVALIYDEKNNLPIRGDGKYDNCIVNDNTLNNFFADNDDVVKEMVKMFMDQPENVKESTKALTDLESEVYRKNWILMRKAQMICPPADICLNTLDASIEYDDNGHPIDTEASLRDQFQKLVEETLPTCQVTFCQNPKFTEPILIKHHSGEGGAGEGGGDIDPATEKQLEDGGTRFSYSFTKKFYNKSSRHLRLTKGTHLWSMTLAWFVLMTVGAFTARYYKETAGINDKTGNSVLGLGYWIWVHIFLLLLSLTFMWIGILETTRFRQKPISCNLLQMYSEYTLKNSCRARKRTVRLHRKVGIVAVVFYHIALAISWARPVKPLRLPLMKWKFPLRKFFLWVHVIFAYLGKLFCIISVGILFIPSAICKSIPTFVILIEVFSIAFFAAGWVVQCMEDVRLRKVGRSNFPVPEAIESADHSPCYLTKVLLVLGSVAIHLIFFIIVVVTAVKVYREPGEGAGKVPYFEKLKGIFGTCNVTSSATELQASMRVYYSEKRGEVSDG